MVLRAPLCWAEFGKRGPHVQRTGEAELNSFSDTATLTRVGPGTPMGNLMRQYWVPALKSSELVAGGDPVRLVLLGERLVAFRDASGAVGIMDHRCPHRCASLFFGRVEDGGIRCAYHGWKFDVTGQCVEMPNLPPHRRFEDKIRARGYRTYEAKGLVWVYMGERETLPPLPAFEAALLPESEVEITFVQRECNWLQSLEGDVDTSHFGFLHGGAVEGDQIPDDDIQKWALYDRAPDYHVAQTDWGTMYAAYRKADPGFTFWRFAHFLFPFWTMVPDARFEGHIVTRAWVPMDDTHVMMVMLRWIGVERRARTMKNGQDMPGLGFDNHLLPNTTDWYGRYRLRENAANDYELDREAQRSSIFSGISGVHLQDQAITESMGAITDFDWEHLASSDQMIVRTRRRLLQAVEDLARGGVTPPGVDNPAVYQGARSGDFIAPDHVGWLQAYSDEIRRAQNPTGVLRYAAE
jgi:phenylpropionate dioxygenase-like ring-hydroxylating dioxygenase large terminal subunit